MMFGEHSKTKFIEETRAARVERANDRKREESAIIIQSLIRGWLSRRRIHNNTLKQFEEIFNNSDDLKPATHVYLISKKFLDHWNEKRDKQQFEKFCKYIIRSLESESLKFSYVSVALTKEHAVSWIKHVKEILSVCLIYLSNFQTKTLGDSSFLHTLLHMIVSFTSTSMWIALTSNKTLQGLKHGLERLTENLVAHLLAKNVFNTMQTLLINGFLGSKILLKPVSMTAIMTICWRCLVLSNFSQCIFQLFVVEIYSLPLLLENLVTYSPKLITTFQSGNLLEKILNILMDQSQCNEIFQSLQPSWSLSLIANVIHLAELSTEIEEFENICFPTFVVGLTSFLETIRVYITKKQSNVSSVWHPELGWFTANPKCQCSPNIPPLKNQLILLWCGKLCTKLLRSHLVKALETIPDHQQVPSPPPKSNNPIIFIKKALDIRPSNINYTSSKLTDIHGTKVVAGCNLYFMCLKTITQLRLDIITGLCYHEDTLFLLWRFLAFLDSHCGIKNLLNILENDKYCTSSELRMVQLFCDCMSHYITILDDIEMYEQQKPFVLRDYILMSSFLNIFLYKGISQNLFDIQDMGPNSLFRSCHTLLMVLYRRDCRRKFAPNDHWLIGDLKSSSFLNELNKGRKTHLILIQEMPHIISHEVRVRLFRKYVANDKSALGVSQYDALHPTIITIRRNRIIEDGYVYVSEMSPKSFKGTIRVKFINEQGLDEAGIDQDGVFKEFLEETIKKVFDPSLNLFRTTEEQRLYPSPSSNVQENHLNLFEFVGRILGKAVYEGIVVDVPFASFFLSQLLGQTQELLYSSMDELPSLDNDLYRNLTSVKHYEGDVSELDLTFSVVDNHLGNLITHDLVPGGRMISVTNQNKINYVHLMAHYVMHTQIKTQTAAFIKGFRSVINPDWLALFSTPELQKLMSGDNAPINLHDLRKHTQYYGGFHDSHRVILWLWDVLQKDFTENERALFLKFVTSCSKPPLLGFAHLEPPFSIRCVEVGDDEDTGDTIASVIRGFFTIRKKDPQLRLPSSSTCFNLLKLPNYQKKSILRDKLSFRIC
ncbi:ubiquitin-protein ligase E3B isoform X2 [Daktulosphaira vitifoliae]|uniref:ubiquitin-protein ligase E3B isoform X2 n=1 Tax=Daktulosphaira vitifoliae TaxID=58002 RepID=UPI0021AA59E9|nr:ubiquitin-protein ligase E3B isoform X2 [Daktulosphaira vitifoliae]